MASERFTESARTGAEWLIAQMDDNGRIGPSVHYYDKVPQALLETGNIGQAHAAANWIIKHGLLSNGGFDASDNPVPEDELAAVWAPRMRPYQNAILLGSAHQLNRFDASYPAYQRLLRYQHEENGAFCHTAPDGDEYDLVSTGFCGLACLTMGDADRAVQTGRAVIELVDQQPHPEERLYVNLDGDGRLVTEGFPNPGARYYVVHRDEPDQMYFYAGVAIALLAKLYSVTDDRQFLESARQLYDFSTACRSVFEHGSAGKLAWGCLFLYDATGDEQFLDTARRIGEHILSLQTEAGYFARADDLPHVRYTITAEFAIWLAHLGRYLD